MQPARTAKVGTGLVLVLLTSGVAWHDCLLLAGSAVLGGRLFLVYMDSTAPWEGWRAAIRCMTAGAFAVLAACALVLLVAGNWRGWWDIRHEESATPLLLLAVAGAACCLLRGEASAALNEAAFWLPLLAAAWTATFAQSHGLPAAPCVFALVIAGLLGHVGWRLARDSASGLMQEGDMR